MIRCRAGPSTEVVVRPRSRDSPGPLPDISVRVLFWKKGGPHAKSNSSQREVSLYGVCIAHIHEGVISAPLTGALQNIH